MGGIHRRGEAGAATQGERGQVRACRRAPGGVGSGYGVGRGGGVSGLYYVTSEDRPLRRLVCRLIGHDMGATIYGSPHATSLWAPRCYRCDGQADLFFMSPPAGNA